jgi:hypothetical protein
MTPLAREGIAMKIAPTYRLLGACLVVLGAFATGAHAAEGAWQEDMVRRFQMDQVDTDKDSLVSRKEFLRRMDEAWSAQAAAMGMDGDRMTLDQYRAFVRHFGLDVGRP